MEKGNKTFMTNISRDKYLTTTISTGNHSSHDKAAQVREVMYGVIAALSFLLNLLFCLVMVKDLGS